MTNTITLQQRIDAIDGDPILHIGSGSAFFFVGPLDEYEECIDSISCKMLSDAREALDSMQREKVVFAKLVQKLKSLNPRLEDTAALKELLALAREVSAGAKKRIIINRVLPRTTKYIENFVPLRDRPCNEPYERIQEDGLVLIVEGTEKGRYWDRQEFVNGVPSDEAEDYEEAIG